MNRWLHPLLGIALGTLTVWYVFPRLPTGIFQSLESDRWFEVLSIEVDSVHIGTLPDVRVARMIHAPFTASWIASIRRKEDTGFTVFCARQGINDYRPYASLPARTDLNWWLDIPPNPQCPELPVGEYILTISWELEVDSASSMVVQAESNVFEVIE
jgi:hypothetical protein